MRLVHETYEYFLNSALFEFGGNLRTMPAQGNMDGAIENAARFAQAVYKRLTLGV